MSVLLESFPSRRGHGPLGPAHDLAVDNILEASGCQREDVEKLASSVDFVVKTSGF